MKQTLSQKLKKANQQEQFCQDIKKQAKQCYKQTCKQAQEKCKDQTQSLQQKQEACKTKRKCQRVKTDGTIQVQDGQVGFGCNINIKQHNNCVRTASSRDPKTIVRKSSQQSSKRLQSSGLFANLFK